MTLRLERMPTHSLSKGSSTAWRLTFAGGCKISDDMVMRVWPAHFRITPDVMVEAR